MSDFRTRATETLHDYRDRVDANRQMYDDTGDDAYDRVLKASLTELESLATQLAREMVVEELRIARGRVKTASYKPLTEEALDWAFYRLAELKKPEDTHGN